MIQEHKMSSSIKDALTPLVDLDVNGDLDRIHGRIMLLVVDDVDEDLVEK